MRQDAAGRVDSRKIALLQGEGMLLSRPPFEGLAQSKQQMKTQILTKLALCGAAISIGTHGNTARAEDSPLKTDEQKFSYAVGTRVGTSVKRTGVSADADELGLAITDVLKGGKLLLTPMEANTILKALPAPPADLPAGGKDFKDVKAKVGYALGMYFGQMILRDDTNTDVPSLVLGVKDVQAGGQMLLTTNEVVAVLKDHEDKAMAKAKAEAAANLKAGRDFLARNKAEPGVSTLPDGLQYKIITAGVGPKPKLSDTVRVNYRGTLVDGTEFDASKPGNPVTFGVGGVIPGWTEILQLMWTGSKWKVFIPSELAYGERGFPPKIGPDCALVFDVELVGIEPGAPVPPAAGK